MTANPDDREAATSDNVAELFAPLRKTVQLRVSPAQAFARFAERFGDWWPLANGHCVFGEASASCHIEPVVGGRIVESANDGRTCEWGRVEVWEPPHRLQFAWHPGREAATAQSVEVQFTANATGTCVTLEHRDWHLLGEHAAPQHDSYNRGWDYVLGTFGSHAARAGQRAVFNATPRGRIAAFATNVNAPIERVFELIATARGLDQWFTDSATLDPKIGGQLVFRWRGLGGDGEDLEFFGRVYAYAIPAKFVFDWQADSGEYDLRCSFELATTPSGTKVSVYEAGFRDDDVGLQDLLNRQSGWSQSLMQLKAFAEHGIRLV